MLPDSKLEQLTREGKTDTEIRRWLSEHENITVTRQAISAWRKRRGMDMRPLVRTMPWAVKPEHARMEPARVIRWHARAEQGLPLSPVEQHRLDRAVEHLRSVGGVFHYEPDTDPYWFIVEARQGIDTGVIRVPD